MRLIDLSQPVYHNSPNCPVHPPVHSEIIADHAADGWRVEKLSLSNHTGSHVDAPLHRLADGASLDDMPLEAFVGAAMIVDLRGLPPDAPIGAQQLGEKLPSDVSDTIILLATGWGQKRARSDEWLYHSPYLSPQGAEWLAGRKIRAVGIDHYSIGGSGEPSNAHTHEILLGVGIWIVEELYFPDEVFALRQPVTLWSLPINLKGHSGAFCRPVLVVD